MVRQGSPQVVRQSLPAGRQAYPEMKKALLLENINSKAANTLIEQGFEVETLPHALEEAELIKKIIGLDVLGIRSQTKITSNVLSFAKNLKVIGAFCIGTNQIDLDICQKQNIAVFNAPYSSGRSVAELAVGEIIMLARRVFEKSLNLQKGIWDKSANGCFEIRGKKLGIIGFGNIGMQLSVLAESLGMKVYFYDCLEKHPFGGAQKCSSLKKFLSTVDIISVHVDGRKENGNLISEREFNFMKKGVLFLNLSRGHVVDMDALVKNIKSGKVAGAAIDVYPKEPHSSRNKFLSPLQGLDNVILTPHIGGATTEAQVSIAEYVSNKIIDYFKK